MLRNIIIILTLLVTMITSKQVICGDIYCLFPSGGEDLICSDTITVKLYNLDNNDGLYKVSVWSQSQQEWQLVKDSVLIPSNTFKIKLPTFQNILARIKIENLSNGVVILSNYFSMNSQMLKNSVDYTNTDRKSEDITLYPNPTTGSLNIVSNDKITDIEVYDLNGNNVEVYSNGNQLFMSNFIHGTYFILIKTVKNSYYKKIIKY